MTKRCCVCKRDLPGSEFWKSARRKDGLKPDCKQCAKENRKTWIDDNPDKERQYRGRKKPSTKARDRSRTKQWRDENREQYRIGKRRTEATRRARKFDAYVETIDPLVVFERDKGICGICEESVVGDFHIDHIIALAKGGKHSYQNVQLAHPTCNVSKGTS